MARSSIFHKRSLVAVTDSALKPFVAHRVRVRYVLTEFSEAVVADRAQLRVCLDKFQQISALLRSTQYTKYSKSVYLAL